MFELNSIYSSTICDAANAYCTNKLSRRCGIIFPFRVYFYVYSSPLSPLIGHLRFGYFHPNINPMSKDLWVCKSNYTKNIIRNQCLLDIATIQDICSQESEEDIVWQPHYADICFFNGVFLSRFIDIDIKITTAPTSHINYNHLVRIQYHDTSIEDDLVYNPIKLIAQLKGYSATNI